MIKSPNAKAWIAALVTVVVYILTTAGVAFPDGFTVSDTQFSDALMYLLGLVASGGIGGYLVWLTPNKE